MEQFSQEAIRQSGYLRGGFAAHYDAHRPRPPKLLLDALERYAGGSLRLVVDLGSGTGLSTRAWASRAEQVVGVEANPQMLAEARARTDEDNVGYVERFAHETGLADGTADVVACSQSFHWMEREAVLTEAARMLRPGGVFAAYDYDPVPLVHPEIDAAFADHLALRARFRDEHRVEAGWTRRPKAGHLAAIEASGGFRFARELVLHDELELNGDDLIGFVRSLGLVPELIALGASEDDLGLTRLERTARDVLGNRRVPALRGYRVRLGVR